MVKKLKVLFAGEGIYILTSIYKGRDSFNMGSYVEHGKFFIKALEDNNIDYDYIPTNKVAEEFPWTLEELKKYDVIVVSDVGSDTFLISQRCMDGEKTPNRLKLLEQYVAEGGGFFMWGGYLSFTGLYGKGFYKRTPIEKLLPVNLMETDDRVEVPEGFLPEITEKDHDNRMHCARRSTQHEPSRVITTEAPREQYLYLRSSAFICGFKSPLPTDYGRERGEWNRRSLDPEPVER